VVAREIQAARSREYPHGSPHGQGSPPGLLGIDL
jgi:hypothetical protein